MVQGGQFRPMRGTVLTVIANDGTDPVTGRFIDAAGGILNEGATVRFNGIETTISYVGGAGANDVTLTVSDFQIVRTSSADSQLAATGTVPPPSQDRSDDSTVAAIVTANESTARATVNDSADLRGQNLDVRTVKRLRVFFRLVNDGTGEEEQNEYDLPPDVLGDLLHIFKRFRFQDGHYRVYLLEPGKPERLILDVNVSEGRVAPANRDDAQVPEPQPAPPAHEAVPQAQSFDVDHTPQDNRIQTAPADAEKAGSSAEGDRRAAGDAGTGTLVAATAVGIAVGATASPEWRKRTHQFLTRGTFPGNNIARLVQRTRREMRTRRPR